MPKLLSWRTAADRHGIEWGPIVDWMESGKLAVFEIEGEPMVDEHQLAELIASAAEPGRPSLHSPQAVQPGSVRVAQRGRLVSVTAGVTAAERELIEAAARAAGLSTAAWARAMLVAAAEDQATPEAGH